MCKLGNNIRYVFLKLKVIGGHLLQHMIVGKQYELYPTSHFRGFIVDETGNKVYISNRCLKTYLRRVI